MSCEGCKDFEEARTSEAYPHKGWCRHPMWESKHQAGMELKWNQAKGKLEETPVMKNGVLVFVGGECDSKKAKKKVEP